MCPLVGVLILLILTPSAQAMPEFFAEAIAFGAKDCLFCHTEPGGGRTWNDRGHWLMARKQESGQETVAVSWLEDYVAPSDAEISPVAGSEGVGTGPRNVPETYHQGPFFEPVKNEAALQRWIDSRGKYTTADGEWPQYSGDVASSKYSPLDQIQGENVTDLEVAWTWDAFDNSKYIKPGTPTNRQPTRAARARFPDGFKATPLVVGGMLYLARKQAAWDRIALAGAEVGLAFALINLLTGAVWARPIWNTWWTWDPRLTSAAVMCLIYAAYLMLRAGIDDSNQKRNFMSVYGIFAFVSVLTTLFIIRIVPETIHPVIVGASPQNAQGSFEATSGVFMALAPSMLLWLTLMPATLIWHRYRLETRREALERLKFQALGD